MTMTVGFYSMPGTLELRQAIARWHQRHGDDILPENIVVGTGSKELIFLMMNIFNGGRFLEMFECFMWIHGIEKSMKFEKKALVWDTYSILIRYTLGIIKMPKFLFFIFMYKKMPEIWLKNGHCDP